MIFRFAKIFILACLYVVCIFAANAFHNIWYMEHGCRLIAMSCSLLALYQYWRIPPRQDR